MFPIKSGIQVSVLTITPQKAIFSASFEMDVESMKLKVARFFLFAFQLVVLRSHELHLAAPLTGNTSFPLK